MYLSQPGSEHVEGVPKNVERHQTGASVVGKPEHPVVRPISRQGLSEEGERGSSAPYNWLVNLQQLT